MASKIEQIFNQACKFVPAKENISSGTFLLYNNDLHYEGERSWFVIENYLKTDNNYIFTHNHMEHIFRLGDGDISIEQQDDTRVLIRSKRKDGIENTVEIGIRPTKREPRDKSQSSLKSLPDVLLRGRKITGLMDEFTSVYTSKIDDSSCLLLHKQTMIAVALGTDEVKATLTNDLDVINNAIVNKAKMGYDKNCLYFSLDVGEYNIRSMVHCQFVDLAESTKNIVRFVINPPDEEFTIIKVKYSELLKAMESFRNINANPLIDYTLKGDTLNLFKRDRMNNKVSINIPVEESNSEKAKFETWIIDSSMLSFLTSSVAKLDTNLISFKIYFKRNRVIIYAESGESIESFILTYVKS